MKKLTFLCVIVLVVFVVGCGISRENLFELAGSIISGDESVTEVGEPSVDLPVLKPKIVIKSAFSIILIDELYPFPDTEVATLMTQTFVIENGGDADLIIGNIIFIDLVNKEIINEFSVTSSPDSIILPGEATSFDVTFNATSMTADVLIKGMMVIGSNDITYFIKIDVWVTPLTLLYPDIDVMIEYSSVTNNAEYFVPDYILADEYSVSVINVTILNTLGTGKLEINNIFIPADKGIFVIGLPIENEVLPGKETSFQIAFHPDEAGTFTKMLKINTNDPDESSFTIYLTGNGI